MAWLDRYGYVVFAAVAVVLVSGIFVSAMSGGASEPIEFASGSSLPDGSPIRVHVVGEVVRPGVFELLAGQRVEDAIAAAGGPTASAETNELNLARRLRDGEKIDVPSRSPASTQASTFVAPLVPGQLININTATATELDRLPGIGEAYSRRIVDSRTVDGPFSSVDDLLSRRVIPASTLESIRPLITVAP